MNIERINDKEFRAEYEEKIKKNTAGSKITAYLPTVFSMIVLLALSSVSTLFQFNFSFHSVAWNTFLLSLTLRFCYNFIARYGSANLRYQLSQNSTQVKDACDLYVRESQKLDISHFAAWIEQKNAKNKENAYRAKIQGQIQCIDNKISFLKYKNARKMTKRAERKIESLKFKRDELQQRISDEYIKDNIRYIKVKYTVLRVSDFFISTGKGTGSKEKYSIDEGKEISRECFKGIPSTLMLTLLGSLIGINITLGSVNVVSILFDVMAVSINFFNGYWIIGGKSVASLLSVYTARRLLIAEYLNNK